jgi:5-methylcytosine-specific restriction endonuclease McrA
MTKQCLHCGEPFTKPQNKSLKTWNTTTKYCSRRCTAAATGTERIVALNKSRIGLSLSDSTKEKMKIKRAGRKPNLGHHHSDATKVQISISTRKGNTIAVRLQKSLSHRGVLNYNWKEGRTGLKHQLRTGFKYRQWRSDVFTRDGFTCQDCGDSKGGNLESHHIKYLNIILDQYNITSLEQADACEELWNINNGVTLCEKCHVDRHKSTPPCG